MKYFSCETRHFIFARVIAGCRGSDGPASCLYDDHVREIGVRELKAKLGSVLRRVEAGERVRVTRRGRPVADIVPVGSSEMVQSMPERGETMKRLIAEGRVTPATRPLPMSPPAPRDTGRSASAFILAEREEER